MEDLFASSHYNLLGLKDSSLGMRANKWQAGTLKLATVTCVRCARVPCKYKVEHYWSADACEVPC
jgi:hypothetical protein